VKSEKGVKGEKSKNERIRNFPEWMPNGRNFAGEIMSRMGAQWRTTVEIAAPACAGVNYPRNDIRSVMGVRINILMGDGDGRGIIAELVFGMFVREDAVYQPTDYSAKGETPEDDDERDFEIVNNNYDYRNGLDEIRERFFAAEILVQNVGITNPADH